MNLQSKISKNKDIMVADLDGEKVLMSSSKGSYFSLNDIGSEIWDSIEGSTSVEEICKRLLTIYDISFEVCKEEVITFLKALNEDGLVKV